MSLKGSSSSKIEGLGPPFRNMFPIYPLKAVMLKIIDELKLMNYQDSNYSNKPFTCLVTCLSILIWEPSLRLPWKQMENRLFMSTSLINNFIVL